MDPVTDLLTFLVSKEPIDNGALKALVDANPCKKKVSAGASGTTYELATAFKDGACADEILVKILEDSPYADEKDEDYLRMRKEEIEDFVKEGQLQNAVFTVLKNTDMAGSTLNARILVPAPIKLQDEFFFMEFVKNSTTLIAVRKQLTNQYFKSLLCQVACFFALVEEVDPSFRHNDLHVANILVSQRGLVQMEIYGIRFTDVFATVIDFGNSTNDSTKPLDVVKLLFTIAFSVFVEYFDVDEEGAGGYWKQNALGVSIWDQILKPLFQPYFTANSLHNYVVFHGYLSSPMVQEYFERKMKEDGFLEKDFDIEKFSRYDLKQVQVKIPLKSIQVVELLKVWQV